MIWRMGEYFAREPGFVTSCTHGGSIDGDRELHLGMHSAPHDVRSGLYKGVLDLSAGRLKAAVETDTVTADHDVVRRRVIIDEFDGLSLGDGQFIRREDQTLLRDGHAVRCHPNGREKGGCKQDRETFHKRVLLRGHCDSYGAQRGSAARTTGSSSLVRVSRNASRSAFSCFVSPRRRIFVSRLGRVSKPVS